MDPDSDLSAFEAWTLIDREVARLATFARSRLGPTIALQITNLRGSLAVEAQMFQDGAFEAQLVRAREAAGNGGVPTDRFESENLPSGQFSTTGRPG
jgi:hypothetical protein